MDIANARYRLGPLLALIVLAGWAGAKEAAPQWPECGVISGTLGGPAIIVDGEPRAPLFFAANNQFGRDEVMVAELASAAKAGIPFFSLNLRPEWIMSDAESDALLDKFRAAHPQGYFLARIWVGTPPQWLKEHPGDCITKADGTLMNYASPASVVWRAEAGEMLRRRVEQIACGPHGSRFLGVVVEYLQTGEWFFPETNEYMDYSPANVNGFRQWLKNKYRWRRALRNAWNDKNADWDTAQIPAPEAREAAALGAFRNPRQQQPVIDFARYQNEVIADAVAHFARIVKAATKGRSLAGVYYGYTMELNNNGPRALAQSGHLALGRLLECEDIDLLIAPYSYFERGLGQPGHFHQPVDSILLHGKLPIIEEDSYTHLALASSEERIAPGWADKTKNMAETLNLTRRNWGNFLTHRCGMWFLDLLSDGRWNAPELWDATLLLRRAAAELRSEPPFQPEVALVMDEEAVAYLRDTTESVLRQSLSWWRSELDQIGTPVGYYLQSDLARLPDSVKVVILANPYCLDKTAHRAVKGLYRRGATVVWAYAPDIIGTDGPDLERVTHLTGFPVTARFDDAPMRIVSEGAEAVYDFGGTPWQPRIVLTGTESDPLARYEDTGEICAAARPAGKGVAVYSAVPRLPLSVLRLICARSGVHFYRDTPGMTGVAGPYLFLHTAGDAPEADHRLSWPIRVGDISRVVPFSPLPMRPDAGGGLRARLPGQETTIFRFEGKMDEKSLPRRRMIPLEDN